MSPPGPTWQRIPCVLCKTTQPLKKRKRTLPPSHTSAPPPGPVVFPYLASLLSATAFWSGHVQEAPAGGHADSRFACSSFWAVASASSLPVKCCMDSVLHWLGQ